MSMRTTRSPATRAVAVFLAVLLLGELGAAASDWDRLREAAAPEKARPVPWEKAYVYKGKRYRAHTNASKAAAVYLAVFMDLAGSAYRDVFDYDGETPVVDIFAYAREAEFDAAALREGMSPESRGFFASRGGAAAIHLPYRATPAMTPEQVLLHEGAHQFINTAFDFHIPAALRKRFVADMTTLPSVPVWLHEGIATYMEVSEFDTRRRRLHIGLVNMQRLRHLRRLMEEGTYIPLRELLETTQKDFTPAHYASAWGLAYWFLNEPDPSERRERVAVLRRFIAACRAGFFENPEEGLAAILDEAEEDPERDFTDIWTAYVTKRSGEVFRDMTVGRHASDNRWKRWERAWARWIMRLDPEEQKGRLVGRLSAK